LNTGVRERKADIKGVASPGVCRSRIEKEWGPVGAFPGWPQCCKLTLVLLQLVLRQEGHRAC